MDGFIPIIERPQRLFCDCSKRTLPTQRCYLRRSPWASFSVHTHTNTKLTGINKRCIVRNLIFCSCFCSSCSSRPTNTVSNGCCCGTNGSSRHDPHTGCCLCVVLFRLYRRFCCCCYCCCCCCCRCYCCSSSSSSFCYIHIFLVGFVGLLEFACHDVEFCKVNANPNKGQTKCTFSVCVVVVAVAVVVAVVVVVVVSASQFVQTTQRNPIWPVWRVFKCIR